MAELDDSVLSAWFVREVERERGAALLAELRDGRRGWDELDGQERRLASGVALIELALERSYLARFDDPTEMVGWAEIGCQLADHLALDPNRGPGAQVIQALAWAELGNAYRVADDLDRAAGALARAQKLALGGTPATSAQNRILELLAVLFTDQRHFAEAAEILEQLESHHRQKGETEKRALTLLNLAHVYTQAHEPQRAISVYLRALPLLVPGHKLLFTAVHGLALNLVDAKLPEVAQTLLDSNRHLYRRSGRLNKIRLLWLEGKILAALRQPGPAEAKLNVAKLAFSLQNKPFDSALVSLDLALLFARQKRIKELALLVKQMHSTFKRLGIAREGIASLLLLLAESCEAGASWERLCGQIEALIRVLQDLPPSFWPRRPPQTKE